MQHFYTHSRNYLILVLQHLLSFIGKAMHVLHIRYKTKLIIMKIKLRSTCILGITLLCLPTKNFAQKLNLSTIEPFALFTVAGTISNTGTSTITGNISKHFGIINGFGLPAIVSGSTHNADATTAQSRIDLLNVYSILNNISVTNTAHTAAFGGETITSSVFLIASAGSVGGTLILDAQGNPKAVFIIKFEGAFTVGAGPIVVLAS